MRLFVLCMNYALYENIERKSGFGSQEWVSEWLNLTLFLRTADSEVHIVHISHVIAAYTLESLSPLTQITQNLHVAINFVKKIIFIKKKKKWGHPSIWQIIWEKHSGSVYIMNLQSLNSTLTLKEGICYNNMSARKKREQFQEMK